MGVEPTREPVAARATVLKTARPTRTRPPPGTRKYTGAPLPLGVRTRQGIPLAPDILGTPCHLNYHPCAINSRVSTLPFPSVRFLTVSLAALCVGVAACGAPAPVAQPKDQFAVVRSTAEAAYQKGTAALDQGNLQEALLELDRAKVNDPDERADIQEALGKVVQRIQALPPPPTRTPVPVTPRPLASPTPARPLGPDATATPVAGFQEWLDKEGRFRVSAPGEWRVSEAPETDFGTGVVAFRDPSSQAEMTVAVDTENQGVSPELYAAKLELAMQRLPGYAMEQMVPTTTAGNPSVRRTFVVDSRDAQGRTITVRGFQLAVLRGLQPYVLTAAAPAETYQQFGPTLDRMAATFSFR